MERFKLIFVIIVSFIMLIVFPIFLFWCHQYNYSPKPTFKKFEESFNKGYMNFDVFDYLEFEKYDDKMLIILDDSVSSENRKQLKALLASKDVEYDYVSKEILLKDLLVQLNNDQIMKNYYKNNNPFNDYIIIHIGYENTLKLERKKGTNIYEGLGTYELKYNDMKLEVKEASKVAWDFESLYCKNYAENYRNIKLDLNSINKKEIKNNLYEITIKAFIEPINDTKTYTFIMSSKKGHSGRFHWRDWYIYGIKDLLNTNEFFDKYLL